MKPLVEIYYDFIQDFTYENIEYLANFFHMPEKYKIIINICYQYIYNNNIDFDRLCIDLKPQYEVATKNAKTYRKKIFQMKVDSDTYVDVLNKIINSKEIINNVVDYMKKNEQYIKFADKLKENITSMINFMFYNIIFKQYRLLSNTIHFKGQYWNISKLSLKEFTNIYQEEYIKKIFDEIGKVIKKYKFIENELKHFVFTTKILFIENNKYTNVMFDDYYKKLLPYKYVNSTAANELENKTLFSKLTYELTAGV